MDLIITIFFKLIWLAIFYGFLFLLQRFLFQKGFYIGQILFLSYYFYTQSKMVDRFAILSIDEMIIVWFVASLMCLLSIIEKKRE
uniref:Uncharacterized protein n=1 Tax=Anaerobacillus isosaccharinicus TaxID=1532552 RepID=A0A1S2LVQ0_9BACI|nr:hypothetical protein [Anaerobacillus isosaccharinicus]QOY38120.1 hypothetical protein AWH56_011615 [Anaerobacillus isosaccharinicus]